MRRPLRPRRLNQNFQRRHSICLSVHFGLSIRHTHIGLGYLKTYRSFYLARFRYCRLRHRQESVATAIDIEIPPCRAVCELLSLAMCCGAESAAQARCILVPFLCTKAIWKVRRADAKQLASRHLKPHRAGIFLCTVGGVSPQLCMFAANLASYIGFKFYRSDKSHRLDC
jgi:hypothetical protein